ncbi:MAG: 30S ribosomal protein S13 [archaeon]
MAEKEKSQPEKKKDSTKSAKQEVKKESKRPQEQSNEMLIRVFGYDIPGSRNIYAGLTRIKGISWSISNAICLKMGLPRGKKISELTQDDLNKIEDFIKVLPVQDWMKNRRLDPETGEAGHFYGTDLDMKREFDIKRLKEIRSYKGMRHAAKLPVRGQRTRSHFRTKKTQSGGIKKKNDKKE